MSRLAFVFILGLLVLAGCATPDPGAGVDTAVVGVEPTPTTVVEPILTAELEPTSTTAAPTPLPSPTPELDEPTAWIAYIGEDGNIWLLDRAAGESRQATEDAIPWQSGQDQEQVITYCCPQWSSHDRLLASPRTVGTRAQEGYQYLQSLWLYDLSTGESRLLVEDQQAFGFAWKPGENLIAYSLPIPTEYFLNRSQSPEYAQGIWAVEVDTGDTYELVAPERGFSLANPEWSPDGRFVSFEEVLAMEGRGQFAYYDFDAQEYLAWDEVIGWYDWSPDSQRIAYDRLAYVATGEERIWIRDRQGGEEQLLSPDYEQGYAHYPVFSPQGDRLAFLAALSGPESYQYTLFVIDLPDGEPRDLGMFEQVQNLAWTPDGERLIFSAGPYESQQVVEVSLADGSANMLAPGSVPAWQPAAP